jgi:hypothetical protein
MASDPNQPESDGKAPEPTPEAAPTSPDPAKAIGGLGFMNLARGAKLVALLLFLLPWVTISCAEQTLATMSGVDLATGSVTMHNPMTGQSERPPGNEGPDYPVLAAALLIGLALVGSFLLSRALGTLAGMAGSAVAAALISYTVFIRIPEKTHAAPPGAGAGDTGTGMFNEQQMAELIRVDIAAGFWLTLAALLAAILLNWLARTRAT